MAGHLAIKAKAKRLGDLLRDRQLVVRRLRDGHSRPPIRRRQGRQWPSDGHDQDRQHAGRREPGHGTCADPSNQAGHLQVRLQGQDQRQPTRRQEGPSPGRGFTKTLTISVSVAKNGTAGLAITLSGRDAQKLNGSLASLSREPEPGRPTRAPPSRSRSSTTSTRPPPASSMTEQSAARPPRRSIAHGFLAWFDRGRTGVFVNLVAQSNGTYNMLVLGRSGDCGGQGLPPRRELPFEPLAVGSSGTSRTASPRH